MIRQVIETFLEFSRAAEPAILRKRGTTRVPRTKGEKLSETQRGLLQKLFAENPAIETACEFKEEIHSILNIKGQKKSKCRVLIAQLKEKVRQLLHGTPEIFKRLGRKIQQWFELIIWMWRFSKSNGITKGFHRKTKLIQRHAYGYRNVEDYRLRELMECGRVIV